MEVGGWWADGNGDVDMDWDEVPLQNEDEAQAGVVEEEMVEDIPYPVNIGVQMEAMGEMGEDDEDWWDVILLQLFLDEMEEEQRHANLFSDDIWDWVEVEEDGAFL